MTITKGDRDTHYPDAEPSTLGDPLVKSMRRMGGGPVPQILWGDEYKSWPMDRRLSYAEKLASSMNHAADLLQVERDRLVELLRRKDDQMKGLFVKLERQGELIQKELEKANAEKQELYSEIGKLRDALRKCQLRVKELER